MTEPHNCPFTLGQLMALYAIVAVAGDQPKARLLLEHARESIPPAYTEYIGAQLLMLNRSRGAA